MMKFENITDMPLAAANSGVNTLLGKIVAGNFKRNILLVGECGSGKSELARHLPYWFYKSYGFEQTYLKFYDCPNQWDMAGLDDYTDKKSLNPSGYEWIVLDEVDKVHPHNRINQLHGPLQKPGDKLFILTANNLSVLPEGIQSRCMTLNIFAPTPDEFLPYAQQVIRAHGKSYTDAKVLADLKNATMSRIDCRRYNDVIELLI